MNVEGLRIKGFTMNVKGLRV